MKNRLPVTIVTGFLGSGKTTLLRYLLKHGNKKLAVIVNEFGSVGLDGDLFKTCDFCSEDELEGRLVELNNGCLCCTVQDDFLPTMEALLERSNQLDGIVVETSGLALPKPLLQALDWPQIRAKLHVNGVITVVDGEALSAGSPVGDISAIEKQQKEDKSIDHLTPLSELFSDQLIMSDLVLISRADCISKIAIERIKRDLSEKIKLGTPIFSIINGEIDPSIILGLTHSRDISSDIHEEDHHHLKVHSTTVRFETHTEKAYFESVIKDLALEFQIIRLKGRFWIDSKRLPLQVQMVGSRLNCWYEEAPNTAWKPEESGMDFVVLSFCEGADEAIISAFEK
tara:strand:+ start:10506 stop:11528 length:1023 start_codon:yes stop_codon:yes gene_type:complete